MTQFYLVQADLRWEDPAANHALLGDMIADCQYGTDGKSDIVVLPEMFTTGFSMASDRLAESMSGTSVQWMERQARHRNQSICGSLIIEADGHCYNRFLWCAPNGVQAAYDKRHLFRMAGEHHHYSPGRERVVVGHEGTSILPQVCYDLRFPAWSRNRGDYDVLVYVANWPAARREQWLALLRARAIENLCFVVAVNRTGVDGKDIHYAGDSCVIDYQGNTILDMGADPGVAGIELDLESLQQWRNQFPAQLDADDFELNLDDSH